MSQNIHLLHNINLIIPCNRTAFPHLYGRRTASQLTLDGTSQGARPKKKAKPYVPFFVKDTWTKEFLVLSSPSDDKTPRADMLQSLQVPGLGKVKVVFKDKNDDFSHLKNTLEEYFPTLKSQNGVFELLRADRGGNTRPLLSIHMPNTGYTIKYLKEAVPGNAVIYVRPIQSDLDMSAVKKEDGVKVYTQCVNCQEDVPLVEIKEHSDVCKGGSSCCTPDSATAFPKEDKTPTTCSVSTIVLDSDVPKDGNDLDVLHVPSPEERAAWIPKLQEMFPDVSATKLELIARMSTSLQEAVEEVCDTEGQESRPPEVLTISDILFKLQSKVKGSDFTLAVKRDELWMGALRFYKIAIKETEKLWQPLAIIFQEEEGLDAGALKTEFFELLLKEIQKRLFEGRDESKVPLRDSSKAFLLKLAGVAISHSIIQKGPVFGALSPAVYYYLAACDPDLVASQMGKNDVPKNAGNLNIIHVLMGNFVFRGYD